MPAPDNGTPVPDISGHCLVNTTESNAKSTRVKDLSKCVKPGTSSQVLNMNFYNSYQECVFTPGDSTNVNCVESIFIGKELAYQDVAQQSQIKINHRIKSRSLRRSEENISETTGYGRLTSLAMRMNDVDVTGSPLRDLLEDACVIQPDFGNQPKQFGFLLDAMRHASTSKLASLHAVLDGLCVTPETLDASRLFFDALLYCRSDACFEFATQLILDGVISKNEAANHWLPKFGLSDRSSNLVVDYVGNVVAKFYDDLNVFSSGSVALGALIRLFCENESQCTMYNGVIKAIEVIQRPVITGCQGDRARTLAALKAIGNAGQGCVRYK